MQLVPLEYPRERYPVVERPGRAQCVYILLHPEDVDEMAARFAGWFRGREEVSIVDVGTSDKVHAGFIVLEWLGCEIDQLFLAILDNEEAIADYTLYGRAMEGTRQYGR